MSIQIIISFLKDLCFPSRSFETMVWYVFSLMLPTDKHTQCFASSISEKDNSLFSDLLNKNTVHSFHLLNRTSKRRLRKLLKKRTSLIKDSPWTIALIIDSTLHKRSSKRINNAQTFNHGKGFMIGHQWTNIAIQIGEQFIPLPPIPFYTKQESFLRGIKYLTEHEKICQFLKKFSFKEFGLEIDPQEVVVLMDSGYDNKTIQRTILERKWDFIMSLKLDRLILCHSNNWSRIDKYFGDGRRSWTSIRIKFYRNKKKKWHQYQTKQREGLLKGVHQKVNLVCSKIQKRKKIKYLACSNLSVSSKTILLGYEKRWRIEIFHREIKSYLGFEDAGVKKFNALHNHIHYVYVAYNLMKEKYPNEGVKEGQRNLEKEVQIVKNKNYLFQLSKITGAEKLKAQLKSDITRIKVKNAA